MNIEIPEQLYQRLGRHVEGFETPADVIGRMLNMYESRIKQKKPEIIFLPDEDTFKKQLIKCKSAWKLFEYLDGDTQLEPWHASRFTVASNLRANLWSGSLRDWQIKGIVRLTLSIDKPEEVVNYNLEGREQMRIQVSKIVKDHIDSIIDYCKSHPEHISQLADRTWSQEHLGISFPLIVIADKASQDAELHKRYWVQEHIVNGQKYRFCSQLGGNTMVGTKTMSEYHGERFIHYLRARNLILPAYQTENIQFFVKI